MFLYQISAFTSREQIHERYLILASGRRVNTTKNKSVKQHSKFTIRYVLNLHMYWYFSCIALMNVCVL